MAGKLKVFSGGEDTAAPRRPAVLGQLEQSFAPLPKDEVPDFYGYKPRSKRKYQLTEAEMQKAIVCLSNGMTWDYTIRFMFSAEAEKLLSYDSVTPAQWSAAERYLQYLCRHNVKVSSVRSGQYGLLRANVIETCTKLKAYQIKRSLITREKLAK